MNQTIFVCCLIVILFVQYSSSISIRAECQDVDLNCQYWASNGECSTYPEYMLTKCCISCLLQSVKDNKEHNNKKNDTQRNTTLVNDHQSNTTLVNDHQSNTTLVNDHQSNTTLVNDHQSNTTLVNDHQRNTTLVNDIQSNITHKNDTEKVCFDEHMDCEDRASTGECSTKPEYMLTKCCISCLKIEVNKGNDHEKNGTQMDDNMKDDNKSHNIDENKFLELIEALKDLNIQEA